MTASTLDLHHQERRLLEERQDLLDDIRRTQELEMSGRRASAGELSRVPTHPADAASDAQESEKELANAHRESEKLARIDEALRLLREDPGEYGACERCGSAIAPERLDIIPWTRLCAPCARAEELEAGGG